MKQEIDMSKYTIGIDPYDKQETLEKVAENSFLANKLENSNAVEKAHYIAGFREGARWQMERSYSEEDMKSAFKVGFSIGYGSDVHAIDEKNRTCEEWFEQFKKK